MLTEKDCCDYETCVALKELGYDYPSNYTYVNNIRVKDEISEKHPGLSDDGYLDLVDEYGGPYKRDEVYGKYIEPLKRWSRNSLINGPYELCVCAHLYEVQKWLREEQKIHIAPRIYLYHDVNLDEQVSWECNIYVEWAAIYTIGKSLTYEDALLLGIKEAIKILNELH